jgi:subfamily B ATP-binding cassette protein MsbA
MQQYLKILRFALPYSRQIILSVLFNIGTVLFSLASITTLIPILRIIFNTAKPQTSPVEYTGILGLKDYLTGQLNYKMYTWSEAIGPQRMLFYVLLVTVGLFLLKNLFRFLGAIAITYIKNGVERDLRASLHKKFLELPIAYFSERRKGDLIARFSTDVLDIQYAVLSSVHRLVQDPLMIILTLGILILFSAKLTLLVIVLLPISGFIISRIGKTLKKPAQAAKQELAVLLSQLEEHISGIQIIKSYVAERRVHKHFSDSNQRYFRYMNKTMFRRDLSSPVSEVLGALILVVIVWYGGNLILNTNELEADFFITYIVLFYQVTVPAKSLSNAFYDIKRGEASADRVLEILETENEMTDAADAKEVSAFESDLKLVDVTFSYEEKVVIDQLSLTIKKGSSVALVGQSGSGKSTIASLINRFYDPQGGSILLDGKDIRTLKQKSYRHLIGFISQDAVLFNDTIRNNIAFGVESATEEEIIAAAKIANAHTFICEQEQGYDTIIGDRGMKLSGGQRQRLTIARAILKDPQLLILDEATSALDSESEQLVQEALEQVLQNRTSIVIAHRLSTIQHCDQIVVMKDGVIVEKGKHLALLEQDGVYKKLVDLQGI